MRIRTCIGLEYPTKTWGRKKGKKKKAIWFLFFSFLFFFFHWIFSSPLVRLHFFSWYNNCFFLLFFIPFFSLQTYAFFLYILCTQQICQVHIISFRCNSVCFICFLFLKNGHAWVESTYHITYVPIFFFYSTEHSVQSTSFSLLSYGV